jgi:hypothetical protein
MTYLKRLNVLKKTFGPLAREGGVVTTDHHKSSRENVWIVTSAGDNKQNSGAFYINFPVPIGASLSEGASMDEHKAASREVMNKAVEAAFAVGLTCRTPIKIFPDIRGQLHIAASSGGMYVNF